MQSVEKQGIYLTNKEFNSMPKFYIGSGQEGNVYYVGRGLIYKIYHSRNIEQQSQRDIILDNTGVRIDTNYKLLSNQDGLDSFYCIDSYGVRLRREESIYEAMRRQKNIEKTFLPSLPIYIDNRFSGCVMHYYYFSYSIYHFSCFPFAYKRKILNDLLEKYQELIEHGIFHCDLASKPDENNRKSNVLASLFGQSHIIDIDGKSTKYTFSNDNKSYNTSIFSLNMLFLEIWYNLDVGNECFLDEDMTFFLENMKFDNKNLGIIEKLFKGECEPTKLKLLLKSKDI